MKEAEILEKLELKGEKDEETVAKDADELTKVPEIVANEADAAAKEAEELKYEAETVLKSEVNANVDEAIKTKLAFVVPDVIKI
jgi:hypothetical protein